MATTTKTSTTKTYTNPDREMPVKVIWKISLPNLPTATKFSSRKRMRKVIRKAGYSIKNFKVEQKGSTITISALEVQPEEK